ncbi:MAG: S41 family peptidase [Bacteroidota bacterium]
MKFISPFLLAIFLLSPNLFLAQNTDADYHNRLYYLVKVWGYAKYFHPTVADCNSEWDDVLLEKADQVKNVESDEEFNEILAGMLDELGEVEVSFSSREQVDEEFLYNLNLDWLEDETLNETVKESLKQINENFRSRNHCLLTLAFEGGNPVFDKDDRFFENSPLYPNEATRVLSIARYWNIINYFFPYKYQMDQDWDITLKQFIPPVASARNALSYNLAMREMTTYINDSHGFFSSSVYGEWLGGFIAPFLLTSIEGQTVITKVHESVRDKLKVGDVLLQINRRAIEDLRAELRKYTAASNEPTIERNINSMLTRGNSGLFDIRVRNAEGERNVRLSRASFQAYNSLFEDEGASYQIRTAEGGCQMGYVHMGRLTREEVPEMFTTLKDMPAIVLDVRNYPNGTLWTMVDYLYSAPINFSAFTAPDIRYPGKLDFYQHSIGIGGARPYEGKLILLFNEETQSQAEFTIMGLELHPNALKIGSQTAGADGNISTVYLPGGIRTIFSGLGVFYPDGRETQRIGIVPDIELLPTIEGVRAGKDEMLEYALNCELLEFTNTESVIENKSSVEVFPNPTADYLNIVNNRAGVYTIQVRSALGTLMEERNIQSNDRLNLENYPSGMYFITFLNGKQIVGVEQVVKE